MKQTMTEEELERCDKRMMVMCGISGFSLLCLILTLILFPNGI